jgi:hypothetical protein
MNFLKVDVKRIINRLFVTDEMLINIFFITVETF